MAEREEGWTVARLLQATHKFFMERGIDSARLDAELLLCHVLKRDRVFLYTHYDQPVTEAERHALRPLVKQRGAHVPMAYLKGEQEFYGLSFEVNADVLIPRPETEHVVEVALAWLHEQALATPIIADVGCGSGALAIALASEIPNATVWATDISAAALAVARRNVERHNLTDRVHLVHANMLTSEPGAAPLPDAFDLVVSNPPYVADGCRLPQTVAAYEPHGALFAGPKGLDAFRALLPQVTRCLATPGLLVLEHGAKQKAALRHWLSHGFAGRACIQDLAGHDRVSFAWRGPTPAQAACKAPFMGGPRPLVGPEDAPEGTLGASDAAMRMQADVQTDVQLDPPELARD